VVGVDKAVELVGRVVVRVVGLPADEDVTALAEGGVVMVEGSSQLQSKQPRESTGCRPS